MERLFFHLYCVGCNSTSGASSFCSSRLSSELCCGLKCNFKLSRLYKDLSGANVERVTHDKYW